MTKLPLPEAERRGEAVRAACKVLRSTEIHVLPPDPAALARDLGFRLITMSALAEMEHENPHQFIHRTIGEEAFTVSSGLDYYIVYDDTIRSPERIRFSIFHEFGHILMRHFEHWDLTALSSEQARALEDEANTFARNFLCPPPILDLVRGDWRDPKWARLFCLSDQAWRVRVQTMAVDRRFIDQHLADLLRHQFRAYMFGRRCLQCGQVFTDEARTDRCPACGSRFLVWNPEMESRDAARKHRHIAGATAEDLKPRFGEDKPLDLTGYWELLRKQNKGFGG